MTETSDANGGAWVKVVKGTPLEVARIAASIGGSLQTVHEGQILQRLLTSAKMPDVWTELQRKDRKSGRYLHPAIGIEPNRYRDEHELQQAALGETLCFAYCAARDRVSVSKMCEVEAKRTELKTIADALRECAEQIQHEKNLGLTVSTPPSAPLTTAEYYVEQILNLRGASDPLVVKNHRGDPVTRGVQIVIAAFLKDRFGDRLDRTAATLTAVALGLRSHEVSKRAARSAFSGRGNAQRSTMRKAGDAV
ncbi:hypothetical protein [Acidiphilium sp.]|uniref:hypothetical protein n=1 Tax=Acidiphilium sp. TaxID=527 RepID=UPI00258D4A3E|nr:hypothetical protein [Acidiphilium sp.]